MLLALLGVNIALGVVWSWIAIRLTDRLYPPMRTYLIYENEDAYHSVQKVKELAWKFCVVKEICIHCDAEAVPELLDGAEATILCGLRSTTRNILLKQCIARDIPVYIRPKIGDLLLSGATRVHLANLPFLYTQAANPTIWYRTAKRPWTLFFPWPY